MKKTLMYLILFMISVNGFCQIQSKLFKTIIVDKKIKEFPNQFDLSTPLRSFITYNYLNINGTDHLLRSVSTIINQSYFPDATAPDVNVSEEKKNKILNTLIKEVIIYKDSLACVITELNTSRYYIRDFTFENGQWVNFCEDARSSLSDSRKYFASNANQFLHALPLFNAINIIPTDTLTFINYLKEKGKTPKEFVLGKLKSHPLVMYGENHRRKASWDFLQEVVKDQKFASHTGVVFMEMASHKQSDIDLFMSSHTFNKELLLNVFRDYMDIGWNDKGMFDFVVCLWKHNQTLPANKKIRIIAVDTPRPFNTFHTSADMLKNNLAYDRNEFMAGKILNYLKSKKDSRNALFIVGTAHLCKTIETAGSRLAKAMPGNTYAIFQHSPGVDIKKSTPDRIRHGMFDYAFYKRGDIPIAFDLKNSPFGKEPFDGLYPSGFGTYQDNYDGYLFFGPLDKEPNFEYLLDLYSDQFIKEVDRRLHLEGTTLKEDWRLKDITRTTVINKLLMDPNRPRWVDELKPLKNGKVVQ